MNIEIKKLPKSKMELKIKVEQQDLDKFREKAISNLMKDLQVQGFRKGQVPKKIALQKIDPMNLLKETTELAVKETYIKTIQENKIEALDRPEIEILPTNDKNKGLEFKAKISVLPKVKLPDYKKIAGKSKKNKIFIQEKEIEESLKWLQKSRAKFSQLERSAKKGDFVEIEFTESINNKTAKDGFVLGEAKFVPGFEENLEGMKNGEGKEFSLNLPKDYFKKELAGKQVTFKVKVISVKKMDLPELNDEFAKTLGEFSDLKSLKQNVEKGLRLENEKKESQRVRQEILDNISKESEVEMPEILIKKEQEQMLENFKKEIAQNLKIAFETYLSEVNKTEKEISDLFLPQAKQRVKNFLILKQIEKNEKIEALDQEINEEIDKILKQYPDIKTSHNQFDLGKMKDYTKEMIIAEKILKKLESFSV